MTITVHGADSDLAELLFLIDGCYYILFRVIRHLIFDLDDTLLDTTQLLRPIAETPAFAERIRHRLPLMPGAKENLETLKPKYHLYLLTLGHVQNQQQKINSLGIEGYFEKIYFADSASAASKLGCFQKVREDIPGEGPTFLSIGNRRWMDIREAKKCGMQTCLFKYGEHQEESIDCPEDRPDFEVFTHQELIAVCRL